VARKLPHRSEAHGEVWVDDYFWLREKADPQVAAYLEAENAYTAAVMKPTEALQESLYQEMLGHIKETDLSVPYREGRSSTTPAPSRGNSTDPVPEAGQSRRARAGSRWT